MTHTIEAGKSYIGDGSTIATVSKVTEFSVYYFIPEFSTTQACRRQTFENWAKSEVEVTK